jgi:hypothetical protein
MESSSTDSRTRTEPAYIDPIDLQAAAAAFCHRLGEPSAEAARLSTLHDVLATSRALSHELEHFAKQAGVHYRGIHCAADMHAEATRLYQALSAWSESVFAAGATWREWQEGEAPKSEGRKSVRFTLLHPAPIDAGHTAQVAPPA